MIGDIIARILFWLATIITWASLAVAALLVLRTIVHWLNLNPFNSFVYNLRRITEPMVRPLRAGTGAILSYDLIPLVMAVFVAMTGLFLASIISSVGGFIQRFSHGFSDLRDLARAIIQLLVFFFTTMIFLRIIFQMFNV